MADLKKLLKLKHENIISLKGIVERFPSDQLKHSHIQGPGLVMEFCKMTLQEVRSFFHSMPHIFLGDSKSENPDRANRDSYLRDRNVQRNEISSQQAHHPPRS